MGERIRTGCTVRHSHSEHIIRTEGFGGEKSRDRGIDAARQPDDSTLEIPALELLAKKCDQPFRGELRIDVERGRARRHRWRAHHCDWLAAVTARRQNTFRLRLFDRRLLAR